MEWIIIAAFFVSIAGVLFAALKQPYVKVGKLEIETYALAALLGPLLLFATGVLTQLPFDFFWNGDMCG